MARLHYLLNRYNYRISKDYEKRPVRFSLALILFQLIQRLLDDRELQYIVVLLVSSFP